MADSTVTENEEDDAQCNPSVPAGMEAEASKIRGDAIGNTLYSERWVIKLLIKLVKFCEDDWNEQLETELCLLWDMMIEPDVVRFIMKHKFIPLTLQIILISKIPRLTEIMVGVLGNMSCLVEVRQEISQNGEVVRLLLELLSMPDAPTLLQLMRLIQTCVWDLRNKDIDTTDSQWLEHLRETERWLPSILFILNSSTNKELLSNTVALLDTLCDVRIDDSTLGDKIASTDMVAALLEATRQLRHGDTDEDDDNGSDSSFVTDIDKVMSHFTQILSSFACSSAGRAALVSHAEVLADKLYTHFCGYKPQDLLTERCADTVSAVVLVMAVLLQDCGCFHAPSFNKFVSYLTFLRENASDEGADVRNQLEQYLKMAVELADGKVLADTLQHCSPEQVHVLQSVMDEHKQE